MKNLTIRLTALLLCFLILTSSTFGCAQKDDDDGKDTGGENDGSNNNTTEYEYMENGLVFGTYTSDQINSIKKNIEKGTEPWKSAYINLIGYIDKHFNDDFPVDADFNIPGYYVDAEGHQRGKARLNAIGCMAYSCALAYAINGDSKYSSKACDLMLMWSVQNKNVSGFDGPLSMSYIGPSLIFTAELLTATEGWTENDSEIFKDWVKKIFLPTANSIRERDNNWGDWGLLASTASYNYLGDMKELENCAEMARKRIDDTIQPTGEMPHETVREGNGIWYTYFALAPMTATCNIIKNVLDIDLFEYEGARGQSIKKALDYLLYYYQRPEEWPHYPGGKQNYTPGKTDYPYNLFEAMAVIYNNEEYKNFARSKSVNTVIGHHYAWTYTTLTVVY